MASTFDQPDEDSGTPLLPVAGIDTQSAFDLPYADDPRTALPPPPTREPQLPPPPMASIAEASALEPTPSAAPPSVTRLERPNGGSPKAPPGPALPPNFSAPTMSPVGPSALRPRRDPESSEPTSPGAPLPPPLSAQPLAGPVVSSDGSAGTDDNLSDTWDHDDLKSAGAESGAGSRAPSLPPMVAKDPGKKRVTRAARVTDTSDHDRPSPVGAGSHAGIERRGRTRIFRDRNRDGAFDDPPGLPLPEGVRVGPLTMSPDAPVPTAPPPVPAIGPAARSSAVAGPTGSTGPGDEPPGIDSIPALLPGSTNRPHPPAPASTIEASPRSDVTGARVADGVLVGAAAAAVAAALWWLVVVVTETQFPYLALILGLLVGQGVLSGSRRGSGALGALAGILTLFSLSVAQYFISRSLAITQLGADAPLWNGTGAAVDVVRSAYQDDLLTLVFVLLATAGAAVTAGRPTARALY